MDRVRDIRLIEFVSMKPSDVPHKSGLRRLRLYVYIHICIYIYTCIYIDTNKNGPTDIHLKECARYLQCVAVCYSVLQCAAVCCSVLQCVAVCRSIWMKELSENESLRGRRPFVCRTSKYSYIYINMCAYI